MDVLRNLKPDMVDMPTALHERINRGEISYEDARHKTHLMGQLLSNTSAMKSDGTTKYTRLPLEHREFFSRCCQEPLCYNPNGLGVDDPHPILLAMEAHEDGLAQHMLANGAWAGFYSSPIIASSDVRSITEFVKTALKHGDVTTFKACIDWLKEQGADDPLAIASRNMNDHFSVSKGDATALFEEVIASDHVPSILPKIDYLLGLGLDPFVGQEGAKLLVPHATSILPMEKTADEAASAEVIVGLLKRGFGRYLHRNMPSAPHLAGLTNSNNTWGMESNLTIKRAINEAREQVTVKVRAFVDRYDERPDKRALLEGERDFYTIDNLTAADLTEAFGFNEHPAILESPRWHGHEERFCELFQQTPKHVQRELMEDSLCAPRVKQLLANGLAMHSNRQHKPLGSWTSRTNSVSIQAAHPSI